MKALSESLQFVDVATARDAPGVRLVVEGLLPSPWSEAAKSLFQVKGIAALGVRFRRRDAELAAWTGSHNVPVVFYDGEPARTGWAEILALAERLGGDVSLVPDEADARVRLHGLAHEIAGEGGLGWNSRLLMIHGSLVSNGAQSFPMPVAQYLARKYGYTPERVPAARARIVEVLQLLDRELATSRAVGGSYLLGDRFTALDIYLATFLTPLVGVSEADCPAMRPELRPAFAYLGEQMGADLPATLVGHRAYIYERYLPWPISL
jgi:glutathione S-transferase